MLSVIMTALPQPDQAVGSWQRSMLVYHSVVSIGHGDTMLCDQLIEDFDRLLPA
jgi:hypothetical protein